MDFWISDWISGFHSGFLDFSLDFWISGFQDFWISVWISADGVRDFFRDGPLGRGQSTTVMQSTRTDSKNVQLWTLNFELCKLDRRLLYNPVYLATSEWLSVQVNDRRPKGQHLR